MKLISQIFFLVLTFNVGLLHSQHRNLSLSKKDLKEIRANSICFSMGADFEYLDRVVDGVKSATIIGIGESCHGSEDVFNLKCELVKRFIKEKGFKVLAFEAPYSELFYVNDYVCSAEEVKNDTILNRFTYWTWMTPQVKELIEWIKLYNKGRVDKIRIIGMDVTSYKGIVKRLSKLSNRLDSNELLQKIKKVESELAYITKTRYSKSYYKLKQYDLDKLKRDLEHIKGRMQESGIANGQITTEFQNLEYYIDNIFRKNYLLRDELMSKNVIRIHEEERCKILIWAHDNHLDKNYLVKRMGSFLDTYFESEYVNISITFEKGSYSAHSKDDNRIHESQLNPQRSIENITSSIKNSRDAIFMDVEKLSKINNRIKNTLKDINMRMIGAVKRVNEFSTYDIIESFDYLISLKKSKESKILLD